MKISKDYLLKKINVLSSIPQQNKNNILTFLKWDNDTLTYTNGSTTIQTKIEAEENMKLLIPCWALKSILEKVNHEYVDLIIDDNHLIVKSGRSRFKLNLGVLEEYPNISIESYENAVKIEYNELKRIIDEVSFSCSKLNKKPSLTGVHFNGNVCEASDSYRYSKLILSNDLKSNFILPQNVLLLLNKIVDKDEPITIQYENSNVIIEFSDFKIKSSLINGTYPDTSRLIPTDVTTVEIDRQELLNAINRISIFAGTKEINETSFKMIGLNFTKYSLDITTENQGIGIASDSVDCKSEFEGKFYCNIYHLVDALNSFKKPNIYIYINDKKRPFYIKDEDGELIQLILPIRNEND